MTVGAFYYRELAASELESSYNGVSADFRATVEAVARIAANDLGVPPPNVRWVKSTVEDPSVYGEVVPEGCRRFKFGAEQRNFAPDFLYGFFTEVVPDTIWIHKHASSHGVGSMMLSRVVKTTVHETHHYAERIRGNPVTEEAAEAYERDFDERFDFGDLTSFRAGEYGWQRVQLPQAVPVRRMDAPQHREPARAPRRAAHVSADPLEAMRQQIGRFRPSATLEEDRADGLEAYRRAYVERYGNNPPDWADGVGAPTNAETFARRVARFL